MNQCERVLRHMKDHGSITSAEAITEYGIYRLASRISDLKSKGVAIKKKQLAVKTATVKARVLPDTPSEMG